MNDNRNFEMVAKTFQGLEDVLADELRSLGAENVTEGRRMVSFEGDNELLYKANLCCRTALRILKPIVKFTADDYDALYEMTKEVDWSRYMTPESTFSVDPVVNSDIFTNSRFVTYRVKDAIVDYFKDRLGEDKRPGVRLQDADLMINVHIDGNRVTLSLDSSGESLHKRGYKAAQTEAPINEVLAAGILLKSGWRGLTPLVDPMCGSGTFLIEAALIAANINPGVYRRSFAFETWPDFDRELFESLYDDDSQERDITVPIIGADISPRAIAIAEKNVKQAGVARWVKLEVKPLSQWTDAPDDGMMVTNPPYGERISVEDMDGLYKLLGQKIKHVFKGYHCWVIGYKDEYFNAIGLTPSVKLAVLNGSLPCELREYVSFDGTYKDFRRDGRSLEKRGEAPREKSQRRLTDDEWRRDARKKGFGGKNGRFADHTEQKPRKMRHDDDFDERRDNGPASRKPKWGGKAFDRKEEGRKPFNREGDKKGKNSDRPYDRDRKPKFDRSDRKPFNRDKRPYDREPQPESENPLAARRNEEALKTIGTRKPTIMRKRSGWRRPDADGTTPTPSSPDNKD